MSLAFSNTTNKNGIIQQIERTLNFSDGYISGNTLRLQQFTADINSALDKVFSIIFEVGGTWQFDDSNHTDYAIITTNIVSGQRDYPFTTDQNGNLILEIMKVFCADEGGLFREMTPQDVPSGSSTNFWDGLNTTGQPNSYDKLANAIMLDPIPNYSETNGLKVYISREGSYFTTSDTTKKPGFAGLFHDYLALQPAYTYAFRNNLANANSIKSEIFEMEEAIKNYYKLREKDVPKRLITVKNNPH